MKKKTGSLILIIMAVLFNPVYINADSAGKTVVYYFHSQFRCYSCTQIEELTEKSLKKFFQTELSSRKLLWSPVNVDEENNRHYISRYSLRSRSVVVSRQVNGKEVEWKNLDRIWRYFQDEKAYSHYINTEVRSFLEK